MIRNLQELRDAVQHAAYQPNSDPDEDAVVDFDDLVTDLDQFEKHAWAPMVGLVRTIAASEHDPKESWIKKAKALLRSAGLDPWSQIKHRVRTLLAVLGKDAEIGTYRALLDAWTALETHADPPRDVIDTMLNAITMHPVGELRPGHQSELLDLARAIMKAANIPGLPTLNRERIKR